MNIIIGSRKHTSEKIIKTEYKISIRIILISTKKTGENHVRTR